MARNEEQRMHDEIEEGEQEETERANNHLEKTMIREKLKKRYSEAIFEIIKAIDEREKEKNERARKICEEALSVLLIKVLDEGDVDYFDKENVERIFEDVFNVIKEKESEKEMKMKMVSLFMRYVRYLNAVNKIVDVADEREEENVKLVCEKALTELFEELVLERRDAFQVDDDDDDDDEIENVWMVYEKVFCAIDMVLEEGDEWDVQSVRQAFEDVFVVIVNSVFEEEEEEEEEVVKSDDEVHEEQENGKSWLHGFIKTLISFGRMVGGRWMGFMTILSCFATRKGR